MASGMIKSVLVVEDGLELKTAGGLRLAKPEDPGAANAVDAKDGVASVERAMAILAAFRTSDGTMSLGQIADATGIYKSTLLRIIASLERYEVIARSADGRYRLGTTMVHLGAVARQGFGFGPAVQSVLSTLAEVTAESACFFVRVGDSRLCIAFANSSREIRHQVGVGYLTPLEQGGAAAHVFRTFSDGWRSALVDKIVACSRGERDPELAAVASPVFGDSDRLLGVLTISGPITRWTEEAVPVLEQAVISGARRLSLQLGASPNFTALMDRALASRRLRGAGAPEGQT